MRWNEECSRPAPGGPGIEARWTVGAKDGVGTAYSTSSRIWYTLFLGVVTEVYYPTIDRPQIRDLQYLVSDGESFFHAEREDMESHIEMIEEGVLGYRIVSQDPEKRYRLVKEIIADPHQSSLLIRTRLEADEAWRDRLHVYVLLAPHLDGRGGGNTGITLESAGKRSMAALRDEHCLTMRATVPFIACSCGFVGENDGWTDLNENFQMDHEYDCAREGNIALTAELDLSEKDEWVLGVAFGDNLHSALTLLHQSLAQPFENHRSRFIEQWRRACDPLPDGVEEDEASLFRRSYSVLLAHEDKTYQGAMIASLSIPWGDTRGDEEGFGGYHLVWGRDLVQSASGLIAAGNLTTPIRGLIYLAVLQLENGGFPQNSWLNGDPFWEGIQLDEVAFPILLAWRLAREDGLAGFDPYPMVLKAARYLIEKGPCTPQERWEEASGYSPSSLASNIAALTCAADLAHQRGDKDLATFIQEYADFLNCHIEEWTVTSQGELVDGIDRHYIRITPADPDDPYPDEDPDSGELTLANRAPEDESTFPARNIVDGGFLELVRYGIRAADDPIIVDSVKVIDEVLKVDTPFGPVWYRYNHDGYGQRDDGGPYDGWGVGRGWPLLTGERGHYELAAGRDARPYLDTMTALAHEVGLLTEQVWDSEDLPEAHLFRGHPTGAAMPLAWAHSEYIRLARSLADGMVFDRIEPVYQRYVNTDSCQDLEIWKPNRRITRVKASRALRIQRPDQFTFRFRWQDGSFEESEAIQTRFGISFVDVDLDGRGGSTLEFRTIGAEGEQSGLFTIQVLADT